MTMKKSASMPFDVNHLWPLITHSSPSRTRRGVERPRVGARRCAGSVIEKPDSIVPVDEREQPLLLLLLGAVLHEDRLVAGVRRHHAEQRGRRRWRRRAPRSCRRGPGSRGPCRRTRCGRCGAHSPAFFTFSLIAAAQLEGLGALGRTVLVARPSAQSVPRWGGCRSLTISAVRARMSLMRSSSVGIGFTFMAMTDRPTSVGRPGPGPLAPSADPGGLVRGGL